ncbi:MAG: cystathionine beta-lyase [Hyphomicrobium sp.]|jgi:cystathionine beta-lyase
MNGVERLSQFAQADPHARKMSSREFIALVASLLALAGLSLDIMLPALPQMGTVLGFASANDQQAVIIVFLVGFAIGQLAFGRMSDLQGRKPVLLAGIAIFIAGTLFAAMSSTFGAILLARLVQGIGAAAARVIAVALVRDRYSGRKMARVMSIGMAVFFSVPVLAPLIGTWLLLLGTWPLIFYFLLVSGLLLAAWCGMRLREPAAAMKAKPLRLAMSMRRALTTPQTVGYAAASGLTFGCTLCLINSAQRVFVDVFGVGDRLLFAFAVIAILIASAALTSALLVERFGMRRLSHASLAAFVVTASVIVVAVLSGRMSFWLFAGMTATLFLLFGFMASNFNALAMELQGGNAGMASSLVGFVSTGLGALSAGIVGQMFDGTLLSLSLGVLALSVLAFLIVVWVEGPRGMFHPGWQPRSPKSEPAVVTVALAALETACPIDWKPPMSSKMTPRPRTPQTQVAHAGRAPHANFGFLNPPVFRGSTVLFSTAEQFLKNDQPYTYGRKSTPTVRALEEAVAELEGGAACALVSSGYQAVSTAIMAFVSAGDHILMVDTVYQPTRDFCDGMLKKFGVETTYYDPLVGGGIAELVRPNTRLIFTESPGSQTFEVQDIPAIARVAAEKNLWLLLDNTWASPLYFRPFEHGVDVSIQAATKYIVGHADAVLGTITSNARAAKQVARAKDLLGICPGSEETYLGMRGLRTLPTRLTQHHRSAILVATWLESRPEVERVLHPGLQSHPQHELWKRDFLGASGLFSIVLRPVSQEAVWAMLDGLALFGIGLSWGGYESLIIPFDATNYRTATQWKPEGPTLRLHIGLEDVEELCADLEAGFERLLAVSGTRPVAQSA